MQKWLWKNTDILPKKGLFQLTRKRREKNDTCWQLNANINSVFRLEIMHQQIYKYNFFHSCVSERTYVEKSEMTIIHYSKFPWPLSESSVGIRNVQCFLINLIYTVGWWNAANNHNTKNSSLFSIRTALLFTSANMATNFLSVPGEKWSRVSELEEKPHAKGRWARASTDTSPRVR